jgi:hypothetical protein
MTERSLSHKSDGRHSSAGHSVHSMHSVPSGRTSSLGLDTNFIIGDQQENSPLDVLLPPPGLFILGSVPSIIRCWLTTNFSHSALLYCVLCTGSQRSMLDYSLVKELGLSDQVQKHPTGRYNIRLPVYLPEAIITQPNSRSNSPAPQLPTLTADFEIVGLTQRSQSDRKNGIRVFLGSDTLRAHSADVLFSQNLMTLYGDDHNKLSVPFVRPEDANLFKNLCTANIPPEKNELKATALPFTPTESKPKVEPTPAAVTTALTAEVERADKSKSRIIQRPTASNEQNASPRIAALTSESNNLKQAFDVGLGSAGLNGSISDSDKFHQEDVDVRGSEVFDDVSSAEPRRESLAGIWGSWRQATTANSSENGESTSGYQRAIKGGRNMKVLKTSSKSMTTAAAAVTNRSSSAARAGAAYEPAPLRSSGESRRKSQAGGVENAPLRWESKKATSDDQKVPKTIATIPRSSNPVGGASAFAWMNNGKPKAFATAE